jgi:ABC-type transport system involved in multi-copper enzyme maturation permease subunit
MNTMRILYHLARADFYERTRRFSFLLILAAAVFMGVLVNNGTLFLSLGLSNPNPLLPSYRGELNSAWIGTMTTLVANAFLGLLGFFMVSDCIKRDIHTGVGQIIATTPVSRAAYLIGKWFSNCLVLFLLVLIQAVAAVIMVLLQSEAALDLSALLIPFFAVALPYMALIAALAVVFDTVSWLRGTVGNAIYFFLWMALFLSSLKGGIALPLLKDPMGIDVFRASLYAGANAAFPNESIGSMGITGFTDMPFKVFNWSGLAWTPGIVAARWLWAVLGLGLILLSVLWFTRFDPSRESLRRGKVKPEEIKEGVPAARHKKALRIALPSFSPLISKLAQVNPFLGVLFAELRLLLNGRRWWWWLGIAGLNIAILCTPISIAMGYLLPIAFLWPLPIWAEMGNREKKNSTYQMVFSSARPVLRQLPAAWLAGILVTGLFGIAGVVFFLVNRDLPGLAGWAGAVFFIPTLALAMGVFSSGSRLFEVIYLFWWYMGPYQKVPALNFISGVPQTYLLAAAGLLLLAIFWRARQVRV